MTRSHTLPYQATSIIPHKPPRSPDVKSHPSNTIQIRLKRKANVKPM